MRGLAPIAAAALLLGMGPASAAPLVVLDPGHGGAASGTKSAAGHEEKVLALAIARVTRARLTRAGVEVRMSRADDRDVSRTARPKLANDLGAEAFVSIHLNHAPDPERRGWETYVLSAAASDALTRRLLAQEEGESFVRSLPISGEGHSDLSFILGDLSRGVAHEKSAKLAKAIQDAVSGVSGLLPSRGLRQAPFTVLAGARVPAVLVEVGYLSNERQARFLAKPAGQRAAGRALAKGILAFLSR